MKISYSHFSVVLATLALSACVTTGTGSGPSGAASAERACARAVSDRVNGAAVDVIVHATYERGAFTNVEVPSRDTRFICHTDANGAVFEVLEI